MWDPCCDMYKVPAWPLLTGVSVPQRLGTSAPWHVVAGSSKRALDRGQKACTKSASTLTREVIQDKSLTSLGRIPQPVRWEDVPLLSIPLGHS